MVADGEQDQRALTLAIDQLTRVKADTEQRLEAIEQQTRLLVSRLAADYQVAPEAIVLAWLLRHPAQIQPVIGTSKVDRLQAAVQAQHISLSRQHWYQLYIAARGAPLP